jgi:hypothetical protein
LNNKLHNYGNGTATDDRTPVAGQEQMKGTMEMQTSSLVPRMEAHRKTDRGKMKQEIRSHREHMQQMMVRMDASQAMVDDNLRKMKEEMRSGQVEIKSTVSAFEEKMEAWIADVKACPEVMEANPEKRDPNPEKLEPSPEKMETNPVKMTSVAVHEEFHTEDATVRSSGTVRRRHRGWHVAAKWRGEPKKLTQGHCGSQGKLAAACRKVSRHARVAWHKRGIIISDCIRAKVE